MCSRLPAQAETRQTIRSTREIATYFPAVSSLHAQVPSVMLRCTSFVVSLERQKRPSTRAPACHLFSKNASRKVSFCPDRQQPCLLKSLRSVAPATRAHTTMLGEKDPRHHCFRVPQPDVAEIYTYIYPLVPISFVVNDADPYPGS